MSADNGKDIDKEFEKAAAKVPIPEGAVPVPANGAPVGMMAPVKIPDKVDANTAPPECDPNLILGEEETNKIRDELIAANPRFWLRILREIHLTVQENVNKTAAQIQAQANTVIVERNRMLAALVVQNRGALTIDPLAWADAEHGAIAFGQDASRRMVVFFQPTQAEKRVLTTGDTTVLREPSPIRNGKRRR